MKPEIKFVHIGFDDVGGRDGVGGRDKSRPYAITACLSPAQNL
jgi:hypothetical protein